MNISMRVRQTPDDIYIAIEDDASLGNWDDAAVDRLMHDLEQVEPQKPSLVDELLDENEELRRDGDERINQLLRQRFYLILVTILLVILAIALAVLLAVKS